MSSGLLFVCKQQLLLSELQEAKIVFRPLQKEIFKDVRCGIRKRSSQFLNLFYKRLLLQSSGCEEDEGQRVCRFRFLLIHKVYERLFPRVNVSARRCRSACRLKCAREAPNSSGCPCPDWCSFSVPLCLFPTSCFHTQTHTWVLTDLETRDRRTAEA